MPALAFPSLRRRSYQGTILATPGLVGYWRMGEQSGTVARDSYGTNHGTYVNAPALGANGLVANDGDKAVTFTAASLHRVDVGDVTWFDGTAPWSFIIWFKPALIDATARRILSKASGAIVDSYATSATTVVVRTPAKNATLPILVVGQTYMLCGTYQSPAVTPYLNGVVGTPTTVDTASNTNTADPLRIGQVGDDSLARYPSGTVKDLSIFNRALSAAEVRDLYRLGVGG